MYVCKLPDRFFGRRLQNIIALAPHPPEQKNNVYCTLVADGAKFASSARKGMLRRTQQEDDG